MSKLTPSQIALAAYGKAAVIAPVAIPQGGARAPVVAGNATRETAAQPARPEPSPAVPFVPQYKTPFIAEFHRTDEEILACQAKCHTCPNHRRPLCCSKISNCQGGLAIWWRNKLSHCPIDLW